MTETAGLSSDSVDASDPFAGTAPVIDGRFRILERVGAGAMGVVYRAEDIFLARPAAIKVIASTLAKTQEAEAQLIREARALARLRHENIVQIHSVGSFAERLYLVMEFVDGKSLEELMESPNRGELLPLETVLAIVSSVARGLSAAHSRGIVHRDVKPNNIVIERDTGRPVLIDFGIARAVVTDTKSSLTVAGTPAYMAPEQIRNDRTAFSHKIDLYALACTAYELITGHPVFESDDLYDMLLAHVSKRPRTVSSFRPEYAAFDAVFARALAKSPPSRHETCDDFAAELSDAARRTRIVRRSDEIASTVRAPLRVLVLANDGLGQTVMRYARTVFERMGAEPRLEYMTGPHALVAAFAREKADVVILDDDPTRGDAMELVRLLRSSDGGRGARILMMTRSMFDERAVWAGLGVRRVPKPVNPRALVDALEEIGATLLAEPHGAPPTLGRTS